MKKLAAVAAVLLMLGGAAAQSNLPDPGVTPDSVFFGLDRAYEAITLFLAPGDAKADKKLAFAEERLAEAKKLSDSNKSQAAEKAMNLYYSQVESAENSSSKMAETFRDRHESVLDSIESRTGQENSGNSGGPGAGFMATGRVVQRN